MTDVATLDADSHVSLIYSLALMPGRVNRFVRSTGFGGEDESSHEAILEAGIFLCGLLVLGAGFFVSP
jgi:hypothetical protein